jgi:hypothetical protein
MVEVDYLRRMFGVAEDEVELLYEAHREAGYEVTCRQGRIAALEDRLAELRGWIDQLGDNHELTALLVARQKPTTTEDKS